VQLAIIGDSITALARAALEHSFRHYDLLIDAVGGTRMADHLPTIERVESDGLPRDWVIELGTNDALRAPINLNWPSDFANEVTALQAQACVIFVTVNPKLGPISSGIDDAIATAVASHPNFHSLDWGTIEFRKPQWLRADDIHPSESGIAELAKLEHQAVLGCQGK
jgi:lysophospholipase L1-like esterase